MFLGCRPISMRAKGRCSVCQSNTLSSGSAWNHNFGEQSAGVIRVHKQHVNQVTLSSMPDGGQGLVADWLSSLVVKGYHEEQQLDHGKETPVEGKEVNLWKYVQDEPRSLYWYYCDDIVHS